MIAEPEIISTLLFVSVAFPVRGSLVALDGAPGSHIRFPRWGPCLNGSLVVEFSTRAPAGLLLYADDLHGNGSDFLELKLVRGAIRFRIRDGFVSTGSGYGDGNRHTVALRWSPEVVVVVVDGVARGHVTTGSSRELPVEYGSVFVGGLPRGFTVGQVVLPSVTFEPRFRGSVAMTTGCGTGSGRPEAEIHRGDACALDGPCGSRNQCIGSDAGSPSTDYAGINYCDREKISSRVKFSGLEIFSFDLSEPIISNRDEISFSFKTRLPQGILLYAGESDDFTCVSLQKSGISVRIRFGSGSFDADISPSAAASSSTSGSYSVASGGGDRFRFDDDQWHVFVLSRDTRELVANRGICHVTVTVDRHLVRTGTIVGNFTTMSNRVLFLGGIPSPSTINTTTTTFASTLHHLHQQLPSTNFTGCLQQVTFSADNIRLDILDLARGKDDDVIRIYGAPSYGDCDVTASTSSSSFVSFLSEESFLRVPMGALQSHDVIGSIQFRFVTTEPDGLILYGLGSSAVTDFFAVEILEGILYLVLDLGTGILKVKVTDGRVDDGQGHFLSVRHRGLSGAVRLDSGAERSYFVSGSEEDQLQLEGGLWLGGKAPFHPLHRFPLECWSARLAPGYLGCVEDLTLAGEPVHLTTLARDQDVVGLGGSCGGGGLGDPRCRSRPCLHGGVCREGWNRFVCDCSATSFTGATCRIAASTATFDGSQSISFRFGDDDNSGNGSLLSEVDDVSLRFRRADARAGTLLVVSSPPAGNRFRLSLTGSRVLLRVYAGRDVTTLLTAGNDVSDRKWHTVALRRRQRSVELRVDNDDANKVKAELASKYGSIGRIEVGNEAAATRTRRLRRSRRRRRRRRRWSRASNDSGSPPLEGEGGFRGQMQQLIVNGRDLFELMRTGNWKREEGEGGGGGEARAAFGPYHGGLLAPVAFRSPGAYVVFKLRIYSTFSIYFQMKTYQADGLVLYSGRPGRDFIAAELVGGQLRLAYDLGSSPRAIRTALGHPISDHRWHEVVILRPTLTELVLRVDNVSKSDSLQDLRSVYFDLDDDVYVGGIPEAMFTLLHKQVRSKDGFHGCLASVDLNGELLSLDEPKVNLPREFQDLVTQDCEGSVSDCSQLFCENGGVCVRDWNSYSCDCDMTSYTGPTCSEDSLTYRFGKSGGLITFTYSESERTDTKQDSLAFGLVTTQASAVLLRVVSGTSNDYLEIELVNGNVYAVYNMGTKDHPIGDVFTKVNDNAYHVIRFTRDGPNSTLQVDEQAVQAKHPTGQQLTAFNNQAFVYIGGKNDPSGKLQRPYQGQLTGLVLNGQQLLSLSAEGDSRTRIEGDVALDSKPLTPYKSSSRGGDKVPTRRSLRPAVTTPTASLTSKDSRLQRTKARETTINSPSSNSSFSASAWNCAKSGCAMTSSLKPLAAFSSAPPTSTPSLTQPPITTQLSRNYYTAPVIWKQSAYSSAEGLSTGSATTRAADHLFGPSYQSHIVASSREGGGGGGIGGTNTDGILDPPSLTKRPDRTRAALPAPEGSLHQDASTLAPSPRTVTAGRTAPSDRPGRGASAGVIAGTVAGAGALLLLVLYAAFKYRSRDEGTYKIDEGTGYGFDAARSSKPLVHLNGKAKCQDVPQKGSREWYV